MNPNSALYWFPRLERAGVKTLRTSFVEFDWKAVLPMLDGESNRAISDLVDETVQACYGFRLPVFLRTDLASAKHSGPSAYKVSDVRRDVPNVLLKTLEEVIGIKDLFPSAIMVRQWLRLDHRFVAFGGHPIASEWRVFASAERVECIHFYWEEDAIRFFGSKGVKEPDNWVDQLRLQRKQRLPALHLLKAVKAAKACPASRYWSVDFALDRDGSHWLIDMATAAASWHPDDCRNRLRFLAPEEHECANCHRKQALAETDLDGDGFCKDCCRKEDA